MEVFEVHPLTSVTVTVYVPAGIEDKRLSFAEPTAAGQESRERLEYWEAIGAEQARRIGAVQNFLPIFKREDAFKTEFISKVKDAGLIYFSGGDPGYLATALHATPLWEEIEINWKKGAALAGCSAGAMALSSDVPNFFKMKNK